MKKYLIIMFSDYGETIAKKIHFCGSYREARMKANRVLYSNDKYASYNIEMDF